MTRMPPLIRKEFAQLIGLIDKVVVSDHLSREELAPWENTRIVKRAEAHKEIAALKQQSGRDIFLFRAARSGMTCWCMTWWTNCT